MNKNIQPRSPNSGYEFSLPMVAPPKLPLRSQRRICWKTLSAIGLRRVNHKHEIKR